MKTLGSGGLDLPFLISALTGGEWSYSRPGRFILEEIGTGTHWIGGWVGPRSGLDAAEKRKFGLPGIQPRPSNPMPVAIPTS
jgi:hypothetical protein